MSDIRVRRIIEVDDGTAAQFWRNGERWMRQGGKEYRLLDLAPHLETKAMMELLLADAADVDLRACRLSQEAAPVRSETRPQGRREETNGEEEDQAREDTTG